MRLFVDNDILLKVAHWKLLDTIPAMVGVDWPQTAALPSFKFRARREDKKLFASTSVARALADRLDRCGDLPDPDPAVVALLQGRPNLDAGDVHLIGSLATEIDALLLTGDKRALTALAKPEAAEVRARVAERVLCLEQWLGFVLDQHGAAAIDPCIRPHASLDTAIHCIIGVSKPASRSEIEEGLASYLRILREHAPDLLARRAR